MGDMPTMLGEIVGRLIDDQKDMETALLSSTSAALNAATRGWITPSLRVARSGLRQIYDRSALQMNNDDAQAL